MPTSGPAYNKEVTINYNIMQSKYFFTFIILSAISLVSVYPAAVCAQTDASTISQQMLSESIEISGEPQVLESVVIDEVKNIPSGFGYWWRNLKEDISIGLTFNPVKKATIQLKFAEERMKLAEYMTQNSTDPKVQEKAQQMIEKANEYMQKIEEKRDEFAQSADPSVKPLLKDVLKHNLNTIRVFEKIEDMLPPEKLEQFQQTRARIEGFQTNFLEKLKENPNVSKEVKDRAIEAVSSLKATLEARKEIRLEQKDILNEIKAGNQEAKQELEVLRGERKEKIEQLRQEYKEEKGTIIEKIQAGDKDAVNELKALNDEKKIELKGIQLEIKDKTKEVKETLKQNREELKGQLPNKNNQ